jgi:hypothetical protein
MVKILYKYGDYKQVKFNGTGSREGPIWVLTLFGTVLECILFSIALFVVRALLKGVRSCQLSSTSHPLHKPWLKSLTTPVILSYPSNTTSACRWRVCSPAITSFSMVRNTQPPTVSSSSLSLSRSSAAENTRGILLSHSLITVSHLYLLPQ